MLNATQTSRNASHLSAARSMANLRKTGVVSSANSEAVSGPVDSYLPSADSPRPRLSSWKALKSAGIAGGLAAVPAFLGAGGAALLGGGGFFLTTGVGLVSVAAAGTLAFQSIVKRHGGLFAVLGTLGAVVGAAQVAPLLSWAGSTFGWQGAAMTTALVAVGAGVASAVSISKANQAIEAHNARLTSAA